MHTSLHKQVKQVHVQPLTNLQLGPKLKFTLGPQSTLRYTVILVLKANCVLNMKLFEPMMHYEL